MHYLGAFMHQDGQCAFYPFLKVVADGTLDLAQSRCKIDILMVKRVGNLAASALAQKLHPLTSKHFLIQPTLAGELDGQDRRRRNENGERERS